MPARLKEKLRQLQPHPQLSPTCDNRVFADNLVLFTNAQKLYGRQAWGVMEVFPNHYRLLANRISVIPVKIPDEPSPRSRSLQTRSVGQCKKLHFWIEYGVHTDVGCNIWSTLCPVEVRRSTQHAFWSYLLEEYGVQQPHQLYKDPVRHSGSPRAP